MKKYLSNTIIKKSSDEKDLKSYLKKIHKALNKIKDNVQTSDFKILNIISNYYSDLSEFKFSESDDINEVSVIRESSYIYCNNILDAHFKKYNVERQDTIKYIYALKNHDNTLRFLFNICREYLLENIKEYIEEDL